MSTLLLQIFGAMSCTFLFGLVLGWLIWKFGDGSSNAEASFWQDRFEQNSNELAGEKTAHEKLREEYKQLSERFSALEKTASA